MWQTFELHPLLEIEKFDEKNVPSLKSKEVPRDNRRQPKGRRRLPRHTAEPRLTLAEVKVKGGPAKVLQEVRGTLRRLETRHRQQLRAELAKIYFVATLLREDEDAWLQFVRHAEWDGFSRRPQAGHRNDALRYVVRFAAGFGQSPQTKRAATHRANYWLGLLQPFWDKESAVAEVEQALSTARSLEELGRNRSEDKAEEGGGKAEPGEFSLRLPFKKTAKAIAAGKGGDRFLMRIEVTSVAGKSARVKILGSKRLDGEQSANSL
jgi:hypothetical protein